MTHSQKVGGGAHGYIRTRYLAKCEAMQAYDLRLREHGEVVAIPRAATGTDPEWEPDETGSGSGAPTKAGPVGGEGGIRTPGTALHRTTA